MEQTWFPHLLFFKCNYTLHRRKDCSYAYSLLYVPKFSLFCHLEHFFLLLCFKIEAHMPINLSFDFMNLAYFVIWKKNFHTFYSTMKNTHIQCSKYCSTHVCIFLTSIFLFNVQFGTKFPCLVLYRCRIHSRTAKCSV